MTIRAPQVSDRVKEAPARVLRAAFAGIGQLLLIADRRRRDRQPPAGRPDGADGQCTDSSRQAGPAAAAVRPEELIPQPRNIEDPPSTPPSAQVPAAKAQRPAAAQPALTEPQPASRQPAATEEQRTASPPVPTITVPRPASSPTLAPSRPAPARPARAKRAAAAQPRTRSSERDRWRSLDQTGNVRLIEPGEADDDRQPAEAGAPPHGATPGGATPAGETPGGATTAGATPGGATAALATAASGAADPSTRKRAEEPPVAGYESWSVPSLRARLRTLNAAQVQALADYERSTAGRTEVLTMFERRLAKLAGGR